VEIGDRILDKATGAIGYIVGEGRLLAPRPGEPFWLFRITHPRAETSVLFKRDANNLIVLGGERDASDAGDERKA